MSTQGILAPGNLTTETVYPIDVYTRQVFFQEAPLLTGLPRRPIGVDKFQMGTARVRSKTNTLGGALADNSNTTVTLVDASVLMVGDVLELASGERVEVTADPTITNTTTGAGTVVVRRGVEGTTAAAQNTATSVVLLYNSRTGAEVDQTGNRNGPSLITQYVQTFQYPVQVGGKAAAMLGISTETGDLVAATRAQKLTDMMRDGESSLLYGKGEFGATGNRTKSKGLRTIITEGASGNVSLSPTNAAQYTSADLHRDVFQTIVNAGGRPDTLMVSTSLMSAFAKWGLAKILAAPGDMSYGTNIQQIMIPLLGYPIRLLTSMGLRGNTAVGLSTTDGQGTSRIRTRFIRTESWKPRGSRGDAVEGEWLMDCALEVDDPSHHSWVEGITAFA